MSIICAKDECNTPINKREADLSIDCRICKQFFHGRCVGFIDKSEISLVKYSQSTWTCDLCRVKKRQNPTNNDLNGDGLSDEDHDDDEETETFNSPAKKPCSLTLETILNKIDGIGTSADQISYIMEENDKLKLRVNDLERQINYMHESLFGNSIDIMNIPFQTNENIEDIVLCIIQVGLEISIGKEDINECYRVITSHNKNKCKVIVKFRTALMKQYVLDKIKIIKTIPSQIILPTTNQRIYINESLSLIKRSLLQEAYKIKNEGHIKYLWTRDGQVMARREQGEKVFYIKATDDLQKLYFNSN